MADDMTTQIFREEAYDLLSELESSLLELEEIPDDEDVINRVFRALHTIKGSGAMFGFDDIASFTHRVETVFDMVRNGDLDVNRDLLSLALLSRDHIFKLLENGINDELEASGNTIIEGLEKIAAQDSPVVESESVEDLSDSESGQHDTPVEKTDIEFTGCFFKIKITPEGKSEVAAEDLTPLLTELSNIGEIKSEVIHSKETSGDSGNWWEIIIATESDQLTIEEIFFFTDVPIKVDVTQIEESEFESLNPDDLNQEQAEEAEIKEDDVTPDEKSDPSEPVKKIDESVQTIDDEDSDSHKIGDILVKRGVASPDDVNSALKEQRQKREKRKAHKQEASSSIRVAAEKLDYLVDLVGELVIVQAQISQVVSEEKNPVLTALSEELERLSDELRDSTLGIRMLPIGTTFSKFRRLVRDLSEELGKEIELETRGAETELDKTVIERLSDPLVHLLRNSIDHGIEIPAERKAAGKSEHGTITLSAEHSGGEVLITISDDGKGMSPDVIKAKAAEKGLISADEELSEKEIFNMIFLPGFSTAKSITSVSGRGVGMDVVKKAIDLLRGSIDIDSTKGQGTIITIRLPLTLAIIDGLQVRVEDGYYVIPLSLVEECVELTRQDIDEANGQQFINLRGEIVPYIRIREWFEIEGEAPDIEQIVITGVEGSRMGIVVDTVIGEHQTVIKSLGRVYRDVDGISGATIKGDGTLALILDVPKLVRSVISEIRASNW
ncbi:chemotaxis protein CheA [Maridesulfovibrio bastinii]|uniref:chemotaxis protein CheA n=1 Tax=Maridesulfovibrio bastinii TaxID=47157 RepID=UPI000429543E|nr:chemotaxis protein CheA [Maridesulfovibrio bastinii]